MKYIGNCKDIINWDSVLEEIKDKPGTVLHYNEQTFNKDLKGFDKMAFEWANAGYQINDAAIEWINYFPGGDFSISVQEQFQQIVDAEPFMVWISKIKPLRMAPWHFDAHTKIDELKDKNVVRYTCYIQQPTPGQVSIVEDTCVYMPEQGSIYQWPSHESYHCGMNGGYTDKYMFNYWGLR
jgi:hypothetical protein